MNDPITFYLTGRLSNNSANTLGNLNKKSTLETY